MSTPTGDWPAVHVSRTGRKNTMNTTVKGPPAHRVAVVVFADVPGIDAHDAANRLVAAVGERLGDRLPTPHRGRPSSYPDTEVLEVIDLSAAARNGYLTIQPAPRFPHE